MNTYARGIYCRIVLTTAMFMAVFAAANVALAQRAPRGYFVLQGVDKSNVRDSSLRDRSVAGVSIRVSWASLHNSSKFQWSWLDSQVKRCRAAGKPYTLRMMTGEHSPKWIGGASHQGAPIPWSSEAQRALSDAIAALGNRYSGDPLLVGVHLTSTANSSSSEMYLAAGLTSVAGYSDSKMIDVWTKAIDSYSAAFPNCALILNATLEPDHRGGITYPVISHCQRRLGPRATFQHNSLKASTPTDARHHQVILDLGRDGSRIGFQMACGSSERRFGGSFEAAVARSPRASYFEVYQEDIGRW